MKGESSYETRARTAVVKLHQWVEEEGKEAWDLFQEAEAGYFRDKNDGKQYAYWAVAEEMRTLFAGLIDFDE